MAQQAQQAQQDTSRYEIKSVREHVLLNPHMYVGAIETREQDMYLHDVASNRITKQSDVPVTHGLLKIIFEAIDNAIDNTYRDPPAQMISVTVDVAAGEVSVANDGKHVEVVQKDFGHGVVDWVPSVIFGRCMSGSNFNSTREGTGMHGLGIKTANILSSEFSVSCFDPVEQKLFRQTWSANMSVCGQAKVTSRKNPPTGRQVTVVRFKPCPECFGGAKLSELVVTQVRSRLYSVAASLRNRGVKIKFNGDRVHVASFKAYIGMFGPSRFVYDEYRTDEFDLKYGVGVSRTGVFEHCSFVNNLETPSAKSTHTSQIARAVVDVITKELKKKVKGAADHRLSRSVIMSKLHIWASLHMVKPTFTSQAKTELSSTVTLRLDESKVLRMLKAVGVMAELQEVLSSKILDSVGRELNAKAKRSSLHVEKLDDAHYAGTARSAEAMLFLVEGDSAKTFVSAGMSVIGRKQYGVFPLRGKPLNVRGASAAQLKDNKELGNLMKIIGLAFNKTYETEEELKTLRYGKVCILTDADVDGGHITGLLVNLFHYFWPSLVERRGFLHRFVTPVVMATPKRNRLGDSSGRVLFYSSADFEAFVLREGQGRVTRMYHVQHLKGLGTTVRSDAIEYFRAMQASHLKSLITDRGGGALASTLLNIFDPSKSKWRKEWLVGADGSSAEGSDGGSSEGSDGGSEGGHTEAAADEVVVGNEVGLCGYVSAEMRLYSHYSLGRSIPSAIDGFKISQRKIFYAAVKKFGSNGNAKFKVAQLAAFVAAETNYTHGEDSLEQAIVKMTQTFPGSNNANLLYPFGSFGSRLQLGRDAASVRYTFANLCSNAGVLFPRETDAVLGYVVEEGMQAEPEFYVPSLPMVLLNGSRGVATGFKSEVPCFHPRDVRDLVLEVARGGSEPSEPVPWYDGYAANHLTEDRGQTWVFKGIVRAQERGQGYVITEIPIDVAVDAYKDKVLASLLEKRVLKRYVVDHAGENEPIFVVYPGEAWKLDPSLSEDAALRKLLRLESSMSKSNMNLLDREKGVRNFKSVVDVVRYWSGVRLEFIGKTLEFQREEVRQQIHVEANRIKMLQAVVDQTLDIRQRRADLELQMAAAPLCIPEDLHARFLQMSISTLTQEKVLEAKNHLRGLHAKLDELLRLTPSEVFQVQVRRAGDVSVLPTPNADTTKKRQRD